MPISLSPMMMRQIIVDHYDNPVYKKTPENIDDFISVHMSSANCIDDINVYVRLKNDVVEECYFDGVACTISTASTDIMCGLMEGKSKTEAFNIIDNYNKMIHEEDFDAEVLSEAIVFINTSKQAARIKCATIGWDAMNEILLKDDKDER